MNPNNFVQQELHRDGAFLLDALEHMRCSGEAILGHGVHGFEQAFAQWLAAEGEVPDVIGVASGTDALELALRACGVAAGDPVLLPAHTAYATLAAVLRVGGEPVFVDVEAEAPVLSPTHLEELLRDGLAKSAQLPRVLIAVHLYGASCDLDVVESLCNRFGIDLIEDCAQACGTLYRGQPVGTRGRFAAFSFYPTKNLAAFGDGGALVVNRHEDIESCRRSRLYGWDERRQAIQFGVNSRLDELQAWVLLAKLSTLADRIRQRRSVAGWYQQRLQGLMKLPKDGEQWQHSYHLYVVEVAAEQRPALLAAADQAGLPLGVHYPLACHQHPHVLQRFGPCASLPNTEKLVLRILSLPLHPYLEEKQVDSVCQLLASSQLDERQASEVRS
jgi:aminotransferase EvaB